MCKSISGLLFYWSVSILMSTLHYCGSTANFEIRQWKPSNIVLLYWNCFDYPRSFKFPHTFLISLSNSTQMPMNLKINLGRTAILTIFSFPILDHRVLLHLSSSMCSWICVLEFQKCFTLFTVQNLLDSLSISHFCTIINEIVFLTSFPNCAMLE